jgi:site-specific DNA-methyltransferase (adenine-specific)
VKRQSAHASCSRGAFAGQEREFPFHADSGGASRFFYVAKPSRKERGHGNTHPTVKPVALMQYLVRLVTPPGGLVLDPFAGSGTTGLACEAEGFNFIGMEAEAAHVAIARRRLESMAPEQMRLAP